MTNAEIDNSIDVSVSILWQYDKAMRLVGLMQMMQSFSLEAVERLWNRFKTDFDISNASSFGLNVWGIMMGLPRPYYTVGGVKTYISDTLYRRLILGRFYLMTHPASTYYINQYLYDSFGGNIQMSDGCDMTITYSIVSGFDAETEYLCDSSYSTFVDVILPYPAGVKTNAITPIDPAEYLGLDEGYQEGQATTDNMKNLGTPDNPGSGGLLAE